MTPQQRHTILRLVREHGRDRVREALETMTARLVALRPAAVCAYCGDRYRDGSTPVSHGLCEACAPRVNAMWDEGGAA